MNRALFVCPNLQAGGAERHWSLLLPRLQVRGVEPRVLTLDGRGPFYAMIDRCGVPISSVSESGRWRNIAGLQAMLRGPTNVIVSRAASADALSYVASRLKPGVRWAVNWHFPSGMTMHPRRRRILQTVLPRADRVLAVCTSQIADLESLGVQARKVTVIANGTDFVPSLSARPEARARLGIDENEVAVLHVGRLESQKRVDRFVDVVAAAQREAPHVIGLIAGVGPEREPLAARIAASGARIRLLGRRDDMPEVLAAADVLCLMSDYEALPFVVLEAMASERPVVATKVGGLADVIIPGETGFLVGREDSGKATHALLELAARPDLRDAMGRAARLRQQRLYTADEMSDRYAAVLTELAHTCRTS
jgi:glycosyltransferase involved in cell wall biosynthesis